MGSQVQLVGDRWCCLSCRVMGLRGGVLAPEGQMFLEGESWGPFLEKLEGWPRGASCARPLLPPQGVDHPGLLGSFHLLSSWKQSLDYPLSLLPGPATPCRPPCHMTGSPAACQSRRSRLRLAGVVAPAWLSLSCCSCSSEAPALLSHTPSVRRLSLLALPHPAPSTLGKRERAPRLPDLDISEGTGHHGPPCAHMLLL